MVLVVEGSFHFNSNAIKANRRHVKAILRRFSASFRKSLNAITSLSVSRFTRPPLRVLKTFLCHNYHNIKVSITQLLYKLIYIEKAAHYRRLNSSNLIDLARSTSPYHSLLTNALLRKLLFVQLREIATVLLQTTVQRRRPSSPKGQTSLSPSKPIFEPCDAIPTTTKKPPVMDALICFENVLIL